MNKKSTVINVSCNPVKKSYRVPRNGFTLIELLVVMLVIVVLAGVTISVSRYVTWRARSAQANADLLKIQSALEEYRAVYGEYPIVGDPNHYSDNLATDPETSNNVPPVFRYVDLVNTGLTIDVQLDTVNTNTIGLRGVEYFPLASPVRVDYRLTYPLKIRPELEGRPPFMDFPLVTVCFLVWRDVTSSHEFEEYTYNKDLEITSTRLGIRGDPVNRIKAVDPVSEYQWCYECSNGTTYTITTNDF